MSPLFTLIELVERNPDEAPTKLGRALQRCEEFEEQLNLLRGYREDYATRIQIELKTGHELESLPDFQLFLSEIDVAIKEQQQLTAYARKQLQLERQHWQDQERKKIVYIALNRETKIMKEHGRFRY